MLSVRQRPSGRSLRHVAKPISKANILTLFSGPRVELVPAPGAGRVICLADWALEYLFSGAAYQGTSTFIGPYYGNTAISASGTTFALTLGAATSLYNYRFGTVSGTNPVNVVNLPLTFGCITADPTDNGGAANGTAVVHVWYHTQTLALL